MEDKDEAIKRLQSELDKIEAQKLKNQEKVKLSEQQWMKDVLAEKERKSKAGVYTFFTLIAFLINPVFGVFVIFLLIGNEIYSLFKTKQ